MAPECSRRDGGRAVSRRSVRPRSDYRSWSVCDACGYQGLLDYARRDGEDYADPEALGVMLDSTCPACEARECVLVSIEHFREMVVLARRSGG